MHYHRLLIRNPFLIILIEQLLLHLLLNHLFLFLLLLLNSRSALIMICNRFYTYGFLLLSGHRLLSGRGLFVR